MTADEFVALMKDREDVKKCFGKLYAGWSPICAACALRGECMKQQEAQP